MSDMPPTAAEPQSPERTRLGTDRTGAEQQAVPDAIAVVEALLRGRSLWLKLLALFSFVITAALLGFGGYYIYYADTIAFDQTEQRTKALADQRSTVEEQVTKLKELEMQFQDAKRAIAEKLVLTWPPRQIFPTLRAVAAAEDGQHGWAVGYGGTILRTSDGGGSWKTETSGTTQALLSIQMASDGQHGWAVGDNGTILILSIPDLAVVLGAAEAKDVETALVSLHPPQGAPKEEVDALKRHEQERKDAEQLRARAQKAAELLAPQVRAPQTPQGSGNSAHDFLDPVYVRAYLNRAIVMLIVFFSVSILLTIFRYSMRLAAQYDGRADALRLSDSTLDNRFHQLVRTMVPSGVDFGKTPRSPAELAFDSARDMMREAVRRRPDAS